MNLTFKQFIVKEKIEEFAKVFNLDPTWVVSIAMVESSLGLNQLSKTGCKGIFQMSSIAMKDLLQEMTKIDDEFIDIACGISFLYLLFRRYKTIEEATKHFCDPKDRDFYIDKVKSYMETLK